ncbi:hypothetical protein RIF29_19995 [Crotalaria pallida]|uniref:Phospholipid/glycerol acyltransferase domain-containing protein n=1 Tax=Crotalaria pallida TaxID=3830 RepID=A0AAN9IBY4_CROPI
MLSLSNENKPYLYKVEVNYEYEKVKEKYNATKHEEMLILCNPIKIEGAEYSNERAMYISNHASPIDIFLMMWLTPTGTVGIAKEVLLSHDSALIFKFHRDHREKKFQDLNL